MGATEDAAARRVIAGQKPAEIAGRGTISVTPAEAGRLLAEVPESAATGRIAEIYADIRRVLGLPMVNLVYRHLATRPDMLEEAWAALRPNLGSAAAEAAARAVAAGAAPPAIARIPRTALASAGLGTEEARLAAATLNAYERANSLNLLGMHALLEGCAGTGARSAPVEPPGVATILPMADLASLPAPVVAVLDEMGGALLGAQEPRIVPSLLRHFARDACLPALLWTALRPAAHEIPARSEIVSESARARAAELPYSITAVDDEAARALARRFAGATSRMLVAGGTLRAALAEAF
jgi:hypothetical protein